LARFFAPNGVEGPAFVFVLLSRTNGRVGGFTPIFSAAIANRRDRAEVLLAHGADPHRKSDQSKTAAEFARERGHTEMAGWLESLPVS
jgi:hypothetical protein